MSEQDFYKERITEMLAKIHNVVFQHQIWKILNRHMELKGESA